MPLIHKFSIIYVGSEHHVLTEIHRFSFYADNEGFEICLIVGVICNSYRCWVYKL